MLRLKYCLIIFVFISFCRLFANIQFREELPLVINGYYPTIQPVISFDGRFLYLDRKLHPDNTNSIEDDDEIWYSVRNEFGFWTQPKRAGNEVNSAFSDVLFSITPDGSKALLYGNFVKGEKRYSGFLIAERMDEKLYNLQPLSIRNYYNLSPFFYATLSYDQRVIIFSIQREDSFGKKDLYISFYNKDKNEWSEPQNLRSLNTKDEEEAPFLAYDNKTLYFASNGRNGLGKKDIYVTRRLDESWFNWSEPVNLGTEINTIYDDNCFYLSAKSDTAYFISYSEEKKRSSIFIASMPKLFKPYPYFIFYGRIFLENSSEKRQINDRVEFQVRDMETNETSSYFSSPANSDIYFVLPVKKKFQVQPLHSSYSSKAFDLITNVDSITLFEKEIIFQKEAPPPERTSLRFGFIEETIFLQKETIFFEYDSFELKEEGKLQLLNLCNKLSANSVEKIIIVGYTDSIGTDRYNMKLSQNRAYAVANYLQQHTNIPKEKLEVRWEGRKNPISDDPKQNRRVEIIIQRKESE